MSSEDKIRDGAQALLGEGEQIVAAFVARPRGWTQATAGARLLGQRQAGGHSASADRAGFALASPMALGITEHRLLSFSMGAQAGFGIGGGVKELIGAVPLSEVDSIKSKRLLVGKVVEVTIHGESFKLEAGAGANVGGLVDAFNGVRR